MEEMLLAIDREGVPGKILGEMPVRTIMIPLPMPSGWNRLVNFWFRINGFGIGET